jgi:ABC-type amino acid transport substrate-binding protein
MWTARLVASLLLLLSHAALCAPALRVGTFDVVPFGMHDGDGNIDGIFAQFANQVAQRAKIGYSHQLYPPGRLYALLQHHQLDLAVSSRNLDRDFGLIKLGKLWQLEGVIVYRANLPVEPHQLGDFSPYLIGRLTGSCPTLVKSGMRLYDLSDLNQGLHMLAAGRIDGLCSDRASIGFIMQHDVVAADAGLHSFTFLSTDVWLFANPRLDAGTLATLQAATDELYRSGDALRLVERYIATRPPEKRTSPP